MIRLYREDLIHHGAIYMRRWVLRLVGVGELRLHHVRTPDGVRGYLHDHPWPFLTWLLWGSYTHHVQEHPPQGPVVTERRRWLSLRLLRRGTAHVICDVAPGGAWTLVVVPVRRKQGERQARWGFWVDGVRVPAREYFAARPDSEQFAAQIVSYIGRES